VDFTSLQFDIAGSVATITLNRPDAMNSLNWALVSEIGDALSACENNAEVRAVVLTGGGRAFCTGADVRMLHTEARQDTVRFMYDLAIALNERIVEPICRMAKPVIAAINGVAAGAGVGMALSCDLRVCVDQAKFLLAYSNVAICPDCGTSYFLPRIIGTARTMEAYLFNQPISAQEALGMGLVNRVVASDELLLTASTIAERLAKGPTFAYGQTKHLLDRSLSSTLADQLANEAHSVGLCTSTRDHREGVDAFAEKRPPLFKGL
jgi:2-(1,2-epoxy-1,2-dihydrophenyl)acetyl-CoA isomerase